jgi:catechol 2,3-dioxygenase-like lactoylglutathione lyase family enzyme
MLEKMCPTMPAQDIEETESFYKKLGFFTVYKDTNYLLMKREAAEVHFFHHPKLDKWACDHGAYIRPSDVDAFSDEVTLLNLPSEGIPRFGPAEDKPWGMREATLLDPNGNLLRIGQEIQDQAG